MVQLDGSLALVVLVKDGPIAMKSPPLAELTIPSTGQRVKELGIIECGHGVKVLIAEMASEAIFARQMGNEHFVEEGIVDKRLTHLAKVQQENA